MGTKDAKIAWNVLVCVQSNVPNVGLHLQGSRKTGEILKGMLPQ